MYDGCPCISQEPTDSGASGEVYATARARDRRGRFRELVVRSDVDVRLYRIFIVVRIIDDAAD